MKYSKELENVIEKIPFYERMFLIDYKKWKKMKTYPWPFWRTYIKVVLFLTPKRLLDINLKTAYKLCKRFEKRNVETESKSFYTMVSKIVSSKASMDLLPPKT